MVLHPSPARKKWEERILKNQQNLRKKVSWTGKLDFRLPEGTKFYHPLPRHRIHPTIPTEVDGTSLNGYERQSINGMYVRITLLAMLAGKIGDDYTGLVNVTENQDKEEYIVNVTSVQMEAPGTSQRVSEGVNPIRNGIVIDHIGKGESPSTIRRSMALIIKVLNLADERGGEWVSTSNSAEGAYKGIIFRPGVNEFSRKELKRLAAVAAGCTLNVIKDGKVEAKYRTHLPPRIYNFDDLSCRNDACISHPDHDEGVPARFLRTRENRYVCAYCHTEHNYQEIWR